MSKNDSPVQLAISKTFNAAARLRTRKRRMLSEDWVDSVSDRAGAVIIATSVLLLMLYVIGASQFKIIGVLGALVIGIACLFVIISIGALSLSYVIRGRRHFMEKMGYELVVVDAMAATLWNERPDRRLWCQVQAAMEQDHDEHKQRQGAMLAMAGLAIVLLFGTPSPSCPVNTPGDVLPFLIFAQRLSELRFDACSLRVLSGATVVGLLFGAMLQQLWIVHLNKARYLVGIVLLNDSAVLPRADEEAHSL